MLTWWEKNFATLELGDRRLNRAMSIGYVLSLDSAKHCQKFSVVEQHSREPMSFANPKVEFSSVIEPTVK